MLRKTLDAALEQHRLQAAEREVLEETLTGTVAILVEVLAAIQPLAFGRAARLRRNVRLLAQQLKLAESWEFEAAAMLSQIGCISVDPRILERHYAGAELSESDRRHLLSQASIGRKLLHRVPRLQAVSEMIERQYQDWPDLDHFQGDGRTIAIGAQLLRAASEFDRLVGAGRSAGEAVAAMGRHEAQYYPGMLTALARIQEELAGSEDQSQAEYRSPNAEQLVYRPIAEEVLRSLRN